MKVDVELILKRIEERVGIDMTAYRREIDSAANSDEAWSMLVLSEIVACKHVTTALLTIMGKLDLPN